MPPGTAQAGAFFCCARVAHCLQHSKMSCRPLVSSLAQASKCYVCANGTHLCSRKRMRMKVKKREASGAMLQGQ